MTTASLPIGRFEARGKVKPKAGTLILALVFLTLALVPRWVGAVQEVLLEKIGPPNRGHSILEFYNQTGWIILAVFGVLGLITFNRRLGGDTKTISGAVTVFPDRLEAELAQGGTRVFPFKATPYIRDLARSGLRRIFIANPDTGKRADPLHPTMFANTSEYDTLSEMLQQAHSDFWLGPDFPNSIGNLDLSFVGDSNANTFALRQGTLYYRDVPLPTGAITSYRLARTNLGLSVEQTGIEITMEIDVGGKKSAIRLGAETINHKRSLVRILEAWGVPRRGL